MKRILYILKMSTFLIISLLILENTNGMEQRPEIKLVSTNEFSDGYYNELLSIMSPSIEAGMEFYDKYHHLSFHNTESITADLKKELVRYVNLIKERNKVFRLRKYGGFVLRINKGDLKKGVLYFRTEFDQYTESDQLKFEGIGDYKFSGSIDLKILNIHKDEDLTQDILNAHQHQILEAIKNSSPRWDHITTWAIDSNLEEAVGRSGNNLYFKLTDTTQFGAHVDPLLPQSEYKRSLEEIQWFNKVNSPDKYMAELFRMILLDVNIYRDVMARRGGGLKVVEWLKDKESKDTSDQRFQG